MSKRFKNEDEKRLHFAFFILHSAAYFHVTTVFEEMLNIEITSLQTHHYVIEEQQLAVITWKKMQLIYIN